MRDAGRQRNATGLGGITASLCFHFALLAALLTLSRFESLPSPPEEGISVDLVAPDEIAPSAAQAAQPTPAVAAPPQSAAPPDNEPPAPTAPTPPVEPETLPAPAPKTPAMITAQKLFSEGVLANPRSRQARQALAQLEGSERIEQLCNLEAMSQIHAWKADLEPDRVVAYAMSRARLAGNALQAGGAAFRSRRQWYNLSYRCELAAGGTKVAGFQFQVGEPVPRAVWAAHELPPEH
ncbi:DUF930 domain-containing protein [Bosea sp. WAO]|uniref:DUF930 domain-containing protein n=1 Tax=Bosea sp. WAO TaxID=406341 RepID=UPI00083317CF|nr:DUF930 domain-containing protein [Bosea sp. WAO]